jgi:hypothetical protein
MIHEFGGMGKSVADRDRGGEPMRVLALSAKALAISEILFFD